MTREHTGARTQICNDLVGRFPIFASEGHALFCTALSATVAEIVAEIGLDLGARITPTPIRR